MAGGVGGVEDAGVGRVEDAGDGVGWDASGGGVEDGGGWKRAAAPLCHCGHVKGLVDGEDTEKGVHRHQNWMVQDHNWCVPHFIS